MGPLGAHDDGDDDRGHLHDSVVVQDLSGDGRARRRRWDRRLYSTGGLSPYPGGHDDERQVPESREEDHSCDTGHWHGFYLLTRGGGRRPGRRAHLSRGPEPAITGHAPPLGRRRRRLLGRSVSRLRRDLLQDDGDRDLDEELGL